MKLLYLANVRLPTEKAHGVNIVKTCEALANAGAAVTLITPERADPKSRAAVGERDVFSYYGLRQNFIVRYVPVSDRLARIFVNRGIGLGYWLNQASFSLSLLFSEILKNEKPDAILTRDEFSAWLLSFRRPFPIFYDMHGFPENWVWWWHWMCRRMDGLIVTNNWKQGQCRERFNIASERMLVAPNGFDPELFSAASADKTELCARLGLPDDKPLVVYTGHLYDWKGADVLAQAARRLPEANFVFVGGTERDIARFRAEHGRETNIVIAGRRPHADIPDFIRAAEAAVLPNSQFSRSPRMSVYSRFDTSPIKMFEYMASGTPIVASDLPSIREVLHEGNAMLVKPDEPAALAAGIKQLLADKVLGRRLAAVAQSEAQQYTWEARAVRILEFIKKFL